MMPDMDGFRFFKELQQNDEVKHIPVLIVCARKNMEDSFLALGVDGFFPKPMDAEKLIEEAIKLAHRKPPEAEAAEGEEKKKAAAPKEEEKEV